MYKICRFISKVLLVSSLGVSVHALANDTAVLTRNVADYTNTLQNQTSATIAANLTSLSNTVCDDKDKNCLALLATKRFVAQSILLEKLLEANHYGVNSYSPSASLAVGSATATAAKHRISADENTVVQIPEHAATTNHHNTINWF